MNSIKLYAYAFMVVAHDGMSFCCIIFAFIIEQKKNWIGCAMRFAFIVFLDKDTFTQAYRVQR